MVSVPRLGFLDGVGIRENGPSALNPGAVFFVFFTEAFLLFLDPAGGSNPVKPYPNPFLNPVGAKLTFT